MSSKESKFYSTADFDYHLPEELIAQHPPEERGTSRMLVLNRNTGECEVRKFTDITDYLSAGDTVVVNNTKVMNARFFGVKDQTGAKIELLLTMPLNKNATLWKSFVKPGKRVREGTKIILTPNDLQNMRISQEDGQASQGNDTISSDCTVTVLTRNDDGSFNIEFGTDNMEYVQEHYGHTPLPPYIRRSDELSDQTRYQTVYAKEVGAVAAPTAGLHFTDEICAKFADMKVNSAEVTLHVGPGTFQPVSVEDPREHKMHSEIFTLTADNAERMNRTHENGNKILAIGTTSVRVLETCADELGILTPQQGITDIFLYPPQTPKVADMLLTNFHLPKSTLLMLVATFAEKEHVMNAYEVAKNAGFKFYSYGDCMLLV